MLNLDDTDRRILRILQNDATRPMREIADEVGLSQAPCWRRINQMKEAGIIRGQVAILDRHKLGFDLCAFIRIKLNTMEEAKLLEFERSAGAMPEVQELQLISTESAYRIRVVVPSIAAYEGFFRHRLGNLPYVHEIVANFIVAEPKYTAALPI